MNIYKCPKCETEFSLGTKFCENCGCNLEVEFIETPTCPKCKKIFSTGTVFCSEDGTKLVSPEKTIPKCVKCEKVYTDGTKFCPLDGGKIIPEALRTGIDFDNAKEFVAESVGKSKELFNEYVSKNNKPFARLSKYIAIGIIAITTLVGTMHGCSKGSNKEVRLSQEAETQASLARFDLGCLVRAADKRNTLIEQQHRANRRAGATRGARNGALIGLGLVVLGIGAKRVFKKQDNNQQNNKSK